MESVIYIKLLKNVTLHFQHIEVLEILKYILSYVVSDITPNLNAE